MAKTLQQLRNTVYALLREDSTNTHFADTTIIDGFLNEGMEYAAVFIEYPRDLVSVLAQLNVGSYPNPADNLVLRTAYFGNRDSITGDIRPVKVVSEETLKTIFPTWMDQTAGTTADYPDYLIQLDRKTVYICPRPNAAAIAKSRRLFLNYNYVPAAMVSDSDTPDLPVPYHNLLPEYALHRCYIALQNADLSDRMFKSFMAKVQQLKSAVTKETKEGLGFSWGYDGLDVDTPYGQGVIFP